MNARGGCGIRLSKGGRTPWLVVCVLASVFLPLPLLLFVFVLTVTLVVLSRAAPLVTPSFIVRFPAPPSLRGPPF